jgi:hypothetical protein
MNASAQNLAVYAICLNPCVLKYMGRSDLDNAEHLLLGFSGAASAAW